MKRRDILGSAAAMLAVAVWYRRASAQADVQGLTVRMLTGEQVAIDATAVKELKAGLQGDLLVAGTPGYDSARVIWNAAIDRHPAVIIRCAGTEDVARAVRFAARQNAVLSVRGGGHNAVGFAVAEGGVMIDLTRMSGVAVDPDKRTAHAGGGATFANYDATTHQSGLASTGPIISMVGLGGYTLGGGIGWLHRELGLGCDNLIAAEMVTANGQVLAASATENPDLFWALRGGGGNFGVATSLLYRLSPVNDVIAGLIFHPLEELPKVAAFVRDFNAHASDEMCVWLLMRKAPASPALPKELHGRPVVAIGLCYAGADEAGEQAVAPLRQFGKPLIDLVKTRPYPDWQRSLDGAWGNGFRNRWVGHYLPELTGAAAATLLENVAKVPSPFTDVKLATMGGAVARVGENDTAFSYRDSKYALVIQTRWKSPDEDKVQLAWTQDFFDAMKPYSTGKVYVNFIADEGEGRVADAYNPQSLARLRTIKAKYDPGNLFRMNQNIRPA
ncbi:MAG TPA: FAD-binding oxidoreductase [Acetobacteraceae bacterium]|nr:FAD-binding oxidoreductase [Acetobacteraceae bacterium]